jgi:IS30 family transposase
MPTPYHHFTFEERIRLETYLQAGWSYRKIRAALGKSLGAISREIHINSPDGSQTEYRAGYAKLCATDRRYASARENPSKNPQVWQFVCEKLRADWSPEEISGRLKTEHPHNSKLRISHETIYQFINSSAGQKFASNLRRGRLRRHRKRWRLIGGKTRIPNRISIRERPAVVRLRQRFGDWEGDLMLGKRKRGCVIAGHTERRSRYLLLTKLAAKSAGEMTRATRTRLGVFPAKLSRTLTLDNGTENVGHEQFGLPTYFCDPYCSWQKGGIENQFGLLRQYLPKGCGLDNLTEAELKGFQDKLNHRPRKCLGYKTPFEIFSNHCRRLGVQLPT